ncbi:hypothetical protein GOP47_0008286 [Adiantum capillus-veneris]|uniref:non-specific serine/threonine protein kinase n=1 Tax=Adiantum capillus-veneris TaxID=13818 RepID=A0A9D4UYI4_ADICA|nr:hypothetical protein GOP47_0008286 [Adiantum capillus-veneris]
MSKYGFANNFSDSTPDVEFEDEPIDVMLHGVTSAEEVVDYSALVDRVHPLEAQSTPKVFSLKWSKIRGRMHGMRWDRAAFGALAILSGPVSFSVVFVFLLITSAAPELVHAQAGFISIDCGASERNTLGGILWTTDSSYTSLGLNNKTEVAASPPYDTLRYFPDKAVTKSCYVFNTTANSSYLIRAGFLYGNYDNLSESEGRPSFVLLFGANVWTNVTFNNDSEVVTHEMIALATSDTASVCVGRPSTTNHDPFISSLEIRFLSSNQMMYSPVHQSFLMMSNSRINFGQEDSSSVRYPDDVYDRIWDSDSRVIEGISTHNTIITTNNTVSVTWTDDLPPSKVMQTARSPNNTENMSFNFLTRFGPGQYYLSLYFAELDNSTSQRQIMDVYIDRGSSYQALNVFDIRGLYNTLELFDKNFTVAVGNFTLLLMPNENSTRAPFINAAESYFLQRMDHSTFDQDVHALETIKLSLNLSNWMGDPCLPVAYKWPWLDCNSNSSQTRIVSLNLSSMNLRSEIPTALADLSALTSVDLHNNFLYGSIPSSLANLRNLTFLDLRNNNLSGEYPIELNNLTDFRVGGNPFICFNNSCIVAPAPAPVLVQPGPSESKGRRDLVVGSVVAAIFVFVAAVLMCALYKCKSRKTKRLFIAHSAHWPPVPPFAEISKSVDCGKAAHTGGSEDVPVYSFADMKNITNNFENRVAAKGANGALYHGTLPDGQEVVVKFLKPNIKQTPMEFLYKVTPLSYVNHKNLLRPIGFCAESQSFMFIYEGIQKGSLHNYLHNIDRHLLDWKTRLNILLQVAQGLEHLHSCSPGIIHGSLKSANVLLSGDGLLAKVSDFGIYELLSDVEATSGYLDPEYFSTKTLTDKSDIYSFGVLILEVVCGRMPFDRSLSKDAWNIIEWVSLRYSTAEV